MTSHEASSHVLLAFYYYPAEHWIHLRTTNPIESTFSTVRLRTKVTRSAGSQAGARFERGVLAERGDTVAA